MLHATGALLAMAVCCQSGCAQGLEQGWVQPLGRTGHPCNRCREWTRKRLGDAQLEGGAQLWAPPPPNSSVPQALHAHPLHADAWVPMGSASGLSGWRDGAEELAEIPKSLPTPPHNPARFGGSLLGAERCTGGA